VLNTSILRPFARKLILGNLAILALLLITVVFVLQSSHEVYAARARQTSVNLAGTLGLSVSAEVRQIDNALLSTIQQLNRLEEDQRGLDLATATRIADEQKTLVPQATSLRFTDAGGAVLNGDTAVPVSVADRDYFKLAHDKPGQLAISEPLKGRIVPGWGVVLARARLGADGGFRGVVYAFLSNSHFVDLFDDFSLGPNGAVSLRSDTFKLIARFTPAGKTPDAAMGNANVSDVRKAAVAANPHSGYYVSATAMDGVVRTSAYQRVPGYPLMVMVGFDAADFFAPWYLQAVQLSGLAALLAAMVAGLSLLFYKRQAIQLVNQREIARLAAEREALLQNGLVGMAKVKDRQLVWHNQALTGLFGYGSDNMLGRPTRMFYVDDATYAQVGEAYSHFAGGGNAGQYRTQLQMPRKDGRLLWIDLSGTPLPNGESLWMMVDITAVKESEAQAHHLALHDPLTGLANRVQLTEGLAYALRNAERNARRLAVCYMDLDGFKAVNDQYGHEAGDLLLREAARRMTECVRGNDLVARMGGDEFVMVLADLHDAAQLHTVLQRLLQSLQLPINLGQDRQATVSASIGVALYPEHGSHAESLIRLADDAMYAAKRAGKGRFEIHAAVEVREQARRRAQVV
jgi:diguanylate cyclase (GGDEF)-like protein/PAS domain S-box-containing protein